MKLFFKPLRNKYFWRGTILLSLWLLLVIIACNVQVDRKTANALYSDVNTVPTCEVGLLLGTNPYLKNGQPNKYFLYRIEAAGDNHRNDYNEPEEMKKALMQRGVPEANIILDYAGFRTLDSVVRAKKVFGKERFLIISQRFHNQRALYLAQHHHIEAVAFNAQDVTAYYGLKTRVREYLAQFKLFIDLWFEVTPRFT